MDISVIIPTLGQVANLERLVQSLEKQSFSGRFDVIIVENSMDSSVRERLHGFSSRFKVPVSLLFANKKGVNHARNLGIQNSTGKLLFFIDDDCWIHDIHLLEKHQTIHLKEFGLFALGGMYQLNDDAKIWDRVYHSVQMRWLLAGQSSDSRRSLYLIGGHFSVKKDILLEKKLFFDENIQYGGSELGFFLKAYLLKLEMRLERFFVIHETAETYLSVTKKVFKQGQGKAKLSASLAAIESQPAADFSELSFPYSILTNYLGHVFWYGYYRYKKDTLGFAKFQIRKIIGMIKFRKYRLLSRVESEIQKKYEDPH